MLLARLNDAAIALYQVLSAANVKHGIFGGYAVAVLGGPRESKDIDCIASVTKDQIVSLLDGKSGFRYVNQLRDDYVAFLWSDHPNRDRAVLVEIFVETFQGATFSMKSLEPVFREVAGQTFGTGLTAHLDPVYIFKGKLRAAATRAKFHDSADLRWIEERHRDVLQQRKGELKLEDVGLAMKRYGELELVFTRIGLGTAAARVAAAALDPTHLPPPQRGDVQIGLLGQP